MNGDVRGMGTTARWVGCDVVKPLSMELRRGIFGLNCDGCAGKEHNAARSSSHKGADDRVRAIGRIADEDVPPRSGWGTLLDAASEGSYNRVV